MDILAPVPASPEHAVTPLAPRAPDLRGRRIGILDNSKPNADVLLGRVAELLAARTGAGPIRVWRKPGSSNPAAALDAIAAGADVFLTGSAD
jgi:hypothetical protein